MPLPLSVIVPVHVSGHLGAGDLETCLRAIRSCDGGSDVELIVVDDASPSGDVVVEIASRYRARCIQFPVNQGPAAARNAGSKVATQPILVFLDADTSPHLDTLRKLHRALEEDPGLASVFGSYDDSPRDPGLVSRFRNLLHHWVHQHSRRQASTFWAGCGAIRRNVFEEAGGFDENYHSASIEDVVLGGTMVAAGFRVELRPEIMVTHLKRWTWASAMRTDLCSRAIPWTVAMWEGAKLPEDLNFTWKHKLSALFSGAAAFGWILSPWLSAISAFGVLLLNVRFYAFLRSRGGWKLAATGFFAHIAHYLAAMTGFAAGTCQAFPFLPFVPLFVLAVQWSTGTYSADWGEYSDENAHAVTSWMVLEWLRHPTLHAVAFAERYYVSYPLLAIGHWPPLFYLIAGVWAQAAGTSRTAGLLLTAIIASLLLGFLFVIARQRSTATAATVAVLLVLLNAHFMEALSLMMLDIPTALGVLVALVVWAGYLSRPSAVAAGLAVAASGACFLLKQTALPLVPAVPLAFLFTRQWRLLLNPGFWIAPAAIALIAGPWHWYTFRTVYSNIGAWGGLGRGASNWALPLETAGWSLMAAALAGTVIILRRKTDSLQMCCLALLVGAAVCIPLVGALREPRHLLLLLPPLAILAAPALKRKEVLASVLLVFVLCDLRWTWRPPGEYSGLVDRLNAMRPGPVLLVANDLSETRMIAAIASRAPAPERQWVRGSKFLAEVSGSNRAVKEKFSDEEMTAMVSPSKFAGVLLIQRPDREGPAYFGKLQRVLANQPAQWRRSQLSELATLYELVGPMPDAGHTVPFFDPRLRRTVGGK